MVRSVGLSCLMMLIACRIPAAEVRTWTEVSGERSLQAELLDQTATEVHLRKSDGVMVTVPLERLSAKDRAFLRSHGNVPFAGRTALDAPQALRKQTGSTDIMATPLSKAVDELAAQLRLPVILDTQALTEAHLDANQTVTWKAAEQPLERLLPGLLSPLNLEFSINASDIVVISTAQGLLKSGLRAEVYRVRRQRRDPDTNVLLATIRAEISPDQWAMRGPAEIRLLSINSASVLVVYHTYAAHREMERRFGELLDRVDSNVEPATEPLDLPAVIVKRCNLDLRDVQVADLAPLLSNTFDMRVELDPAAVPSADAPPQTVSMIVSGQRLTVGLDMALRRVGLTWCVKEKGPLLITTPASAAQHVLARNHRFADLFPDPASRPAGVAQLMDALQSTCLPSSWAATGGFAHIESNNVDRLTVTHTVRGHLAVHNLLNRIRVASMR